MSKHRTDRIKRLGDFLNMESFDLALLEEVGLVVRPWWGSQAGRREAEPEGGGPSGKARWALSHFPQVWSEQDFQGLRQKLAVSYPAAHYFRR